MASDDSGDVGNSQADRSTAGNGSCVLQATDMTSVPATDGDATDYDVSMTGGLGASVLLGQEYLPAAWAMEFPPVARRELP